MKKHLHIICSTILLLSMYACRNVTNQSSSVANSPAYIDSLHYKNQSIYIEKTDSNDYLKLQAPIYAWVDRNDLPDYGKGKPEDTTLVYYTDTIYHYPDNNQIDTAAKVLVLKTQNGKQVKLMSSLSHIAEWNYYVKEIKELNSYLTAFSDADDMRFFLFNKINGHQSVLNGYPVVSPDGRTICCAPRECNGVANCVSFYLYSFSDSIATLQCEKRDTFIGYPNIKWKDNHTVYMQITQPADTFSSKRSIKNTWYAKLNLPVFTR